MLAQGFGSKPAKAKKIKSRTPKASQACPCFSGKPYGECCKPFHEGEKKPQPVEVMRARYAAFAWCVSRAVVAVTRNHSVGAYANSEGLHYWNTSVYGCG